jgi:hypothetical protein
MNTVKINLKDNTGLVAAEISCPNFPQSVVGIIWRYNQDQSIDQRVGDFTTHLPKVILGNQANIENKIFLIEGAVLQQNDNPPTPYQVVISIFQNGILIYQETPNAGGSGRLSNRNMAFAYLFTLVLN